MRFWLPKEHDNEKEEELRRILTSRHSDLKKKTTCPTAEYPHACTACGWSAFITTRPNCTNPKCKWYDRKLKKDLLDENPAIEPHPYPAD